ncbi:MAG: hypothetical protein K0M69_15755 [Youngiibacter sp.]|nr:hypothetical protein [Youngiibacter sp.]
MMHYGVLTIYNKHVDQIKRLEAFQRTVIHSIHWEDTKATAKVNQGTHSDDKAFIVIPFDAISSNSYVTPRVFETLPDKTGYYTLAPGDRIVNGETTFEVSGSSDLDKQLDALTITGVDTFDTGCLHMRHWEVSAK